MNRCSWWFACEATQSNIFNYFSSRTFLIKCQLKNIYGKSEVVKDEEIQIGFESIETLKKLIKTICLGHSYV